MDISALEPVDILWASLECTHFSNAKGGDSRDADSRMLAEQMYRYADHCKPKYIFIENVKEFLSWGPLKQKTDKHGNLMFDKNGKPIMVPDVDAEKLGIEYKKWVATLKRMGYVNYRYKLLNSADFGAYTSRERYFGVFALKGYPVRFPSATHHKYGAAGLKKWNAVKDVLQFEIKGKSIFNRKKPLAERTLSRIFYGLKKYVANGEASFLDKYYSGDHNHQSINEPAATIPTKDRLSLIQTESKLYFIDKQYSGPHNHQSINVPAGSITTVPKFNLVEVEKSWIIPTSFNNVGMSINEPAPTLLASRRYHYLVNPQFNNGGSTIEAPCFTLIAQMGKRPPYLVEAEEGKVDLILLDTDSPMIRNIKTFMLEHGISDIFMRMLVIPELKRIQGFPSNYILIGTQEDQKKFIGNSVVPIVAEKLIAANILAAEEYIVPLAA
jgi:DNA (cytosine-5)-methyltransferase 1